MPIAAIENTSPISFLEGAASSVQLCLDSKLLPPEPSHLQAEKRKQGDYMRYLIIAGVSLCLVFLSVVSKAEAATLTLRFIDGTSGKLTPVRLHVRDASGEHHVAQDALRFGGDCDMSDTGAGYTELASALNGFKDRLTNHYTRSVQFYSDGTANLTLPAGETEIEVFKGPEYLVTRDKITLQPGETRSIDMTMVRWIDMPNQGWFSADDHLHIQRPHPDLNPLILNMMQAEDLHVANLLQMGKVRNFDIAPQYAFGPESYYQRGNYLLVTGQETPRTHFLGHTITLGAPEPIFDPENYLIYRKAWEKSVAQGGINGFAHAFAESASLLSPYRGMAVVLPHDLLHFMEVLQFNRGGYDAWYDVLNLGFRVAPTAGTDYPCADQNIPGHERFYSKVSGPLTYEKWLNAVRTGKTFVTTGPIADFSINEAGIGSELQLDGPETVRVQGHVVYDPDRDRIDVVEIVQNGKIIKRLSPIERAERIDFDLELEITESSWLALRAYGSEQSFSGTSSPIHFAIFNPTSNLHTGAIYLAIEGQPQIGESVESQRVAREWLARLDDLREILIPENTETLGAQLEEPAFDAVPTETLANNRRQLLHEIRSARAYFAAKAGRD